MNNSSQKAVISEMIDNMNETVSGYFEGNEKLAGCIMNFLAEVSNDDIKNIESDSIKILCAGIKEFQD